jgi:hypothetical protein
MATAQTTAEALALVQAQSQARQQIVDLASASAVAEVRAFSGWYSRVEITALASRLAKLTRAAQKQTATSTDAYAVRILRLLAGKASPVGPVKGDLRGVPLESVYGRLADQYRWLTAQPGATEARVLDRVLERAAVQVEDNLTLAFTRQWAADLAQAPRVTGYRRVIHPELANSKASCGLCVVAADRVYKVDELLPVHARCNCSVSPVVGEPGGGGDPGRALNATDLKALYQRAGGTGAAKLKATRYQVVDHGELGPRLTYAGQHHRTEADARRDDEIPPST